MTYIEKLGLILLLAGLTLGATTNSLLGLVCSIVGMFIGSIVFLFNGNK